MNVLILSYICQIICIYKIKHYICVNYALHMFSDMYTM